MGRFPHVRVSAKTPYCALSAGLMRSAKLAEAVLPSETAERGISMHVRPIGHGVSPELCTATLSPSRGGKWLKNQPTAFIINALIN